MPVRHTEAGPMQELTRDEAWALLDREARRTLGMSAKDFIRSYEAGEFDRDDAESRNVVHLAMLLPLVR